MTAVCSNVSSLTYKITVVTFKTVPPLRDDCHDSKSEDFNEQIMVFV